MTNKTVTIYGITNKSSVGSTRIDDYLRKDAPDALATFRRESWDTPIVEIEVTFKFPEPELPTAVGSVVAAVVEEEPARLALDSDGDWRALNGAYIGEYWDSNDLTDIKILFDAATIN